MFFHVDTSNGVPVYEQIARQIKYRIADGLLAPGDLLPSVRELARELSINPNTIARAYRDLSSEEIVESLSGVGLAVRSGARRACQTQRRQLLQQQIATALRDSVQAGLDTDAIRKLIDTELARLKSPPHSS